MNWVQYLQRTVESYGKQNQSNEELDLTFDEKESVESEDLDSNFNLSDYLAECEEFEAIEYYDITNVPMAEEVIEIKVAEPEFSLIQKFIGLFQK